MTMFRKQAGFAVDDIVTTVCDPTSSILFLVAPAVIILLTLVAAMVCLKFQNQLSSPGPAP